MNLTTGELLWPALSPPPTDVAPLETDLRCEVLVIGSGVTGAFCAHLLSENGVDVAVVDRRDLVSGSTPASTGLVMYDIDVPLVQLAECIGLSSAERAYQRSNHAVGDFARLTRELDDQSQLTLRPCLYLAENDADLLLLQEELAARRKIGIDARFVDHLELESTFKIRRAGAIVSEQAFEIDPYRLTRSLLSRARHRGVRTYSQTQVTLRSAAKGEVVLHSHRGQQIVAGSVIFATGYETPEMLRGNYCKLKSTYALATQPLPQDQLWPQCPLIWEHRAPYFYARATSDHRVVCGGEDEDFANPQLRDSLLELKIKTVLARLQSLAPWSNPRAEFAWAGTFAETEDGLPLIGCVPHLPGCYFALGYGGNGITFSLIAAQILREKIFGRRDADEDLFCFERL